MFYIFKFGYVYILTVNRGKGEIIAPPLPPGYPPPDPDSPRGVPVLSPHFIFPDVLLVRFNSCLAVPTVYLSQQSVCPNSLSIPTVYLSQPSICPNSLSVPTVYLSQ